MEIRLLRGFRRLGLVVAVPTLGAAIVAAMIAGFLWATAPEPVAFVEEPRTCDQLPGHKGAFDDLVPNSGMNRCLATYKLELSQYETYATYRKARAVIEEVTVFAIVSAVIGGIWFALCWSLGWVAGGFVRK